MASPYTSSSHSPPPLQHPVPTHPAFIPEPPSTPNSPQGYMRYTSSPAESVPAADYYGSQQPHSQPSHMPSQHPQSSGYAPNPYQGYGAGQPHVRPQQHQRHQQHPPLGEGIDFAQFGVNPTTAQFGMQLGQSAVAAGQEYMQKNFGGHIPVPLLKHHFNVSNSYVIKKLQVVLLPWRRDWERIRRPGEQGVNQWLPPRDDINSPDLYIPVMAFVTYILLAALYSGVQDRFHPEVLGRVATRALIVVLCEFGFIKLGCYLLNLSGNHQVTDLFAYSGYKFVGVIMTVLFAFTNIGRTVYLLVFAYAFSSNALFMLRSLRHIVLPHPQDAPQMVEVLPNGQRVMKPMVLSRNQRRQRITFLILIGIGQLFAMGILVRV